MKNKKGYIWVKPTVKKKLVRSGSFGWVEKRILVKGYYKKIKTKKTIKKKRRLR